MNFSVDRDTLLAALQLCGAIVAKRATMPILTCVKVDAADGALALEATDIDVTAHLSCPADTREPGGFAMNVDALTGFLRRAPDERVSFELDENKHVKIESGTTRFRLPAMDVIDFPVSPAMSDAAGGATLTVEAGILAAALAGTMYCVGEEEIRFKVRGILFKAEGGRLDFCSTTGHAMALGTTETERGVKAMGMIPTKAAKAILKLCGSEGDVTFRIGTNHVLLQFVDGTWMAYRRDDVNFPNYRGPIPASYDRRIVASKATAAMLRRVLLLTPEHDRGVKVTVTRGRLSAEPITAANGTGVDYVPVEAAEPFDFSVNGNYLATAIESVGAEAVSIGFTRDIITIQPAEQVAPIDWLHLIVPLGKIDI
jgi:DNA polymerase-3 subunit beta